jgi:hypothetical protein
MKTLLPRLLLPALLLGASQPAHSDIPPELMAKFLKVICTNSGSPGRISIQDGALSKAMDALGVTSDKGAKVAWATNEADIKALAAAGKLVVCNRLNLLPEGGSIAIVEEDGKPAIYLHTGHIAQSGAKVSGSILRIGKQN